MKYKFSQIFENGSSINIISRGGSSILVGGGTLFAILTDICYLSSWLILLVQLVDDSTFYKTDQLSV